MSIARKLLQRADEQGRRSAVLLDEREHTYSDLGRDIRRFARGLKELGALQRL